MDQTGFKVITWNANVLLQVVIGDKPAENEEKLAAKAKTRMKIKITKFNENKNIYPNFNCIPISRVFGVKTVRRICKVTSR